MSNDTFWIAHFSNRTGKAWKQMNQGEFDRAMLKAVGAWLGIVFRAPTAQPIRTLDAISRQQEGYDTDLRDYIFGPNKKRLGIK